MEKELQTPQTQKAPKPIQGQIMETYAEDMIDVISNDTSGLVQRIIHEQEEKEEEKKNYSPDSKKNRIFLFISLCFLLGSAGLFGYYYFFFDRPTNIQSIAQARSLIVSDNTVSLEIGKLSKEEILHKLDEQRTNTKIKKGQMEGVFFTENQKVVGRSRWGTLIKSSFLQAKSDIFNESFMWGIMSFEIEEPKEEPKAVVNQASTELDNLEITAQQVSPIPPESIPLNEGAIVIEEDPQPEPVVVPVDPLRYSPEKPTRKDVFMLLFAQSFADAFPLMRNWEGNLFSEMYEVFGIPVGADRSYLFTKGWEDGIVQNKNARILYDQEGRIVLMYVYLGDNYIALATTEESVKEIIERLVASKIRK